MRQSDEEQQRPQRDTGDEERDDKPSQWKSRDAGVVHGDWTAPERVTTSSVMVAQSRRKVKNCRARPLSAEQWMSKVSAWMVAAALSLFLVSFAQAQNANMIDIGPAAGDARAYFLKDTIKQVSPTIRSARIILSYIKQQDLARTKTLTTTQTNATCRTAARTMRIALPTRPRNPAMHCIPKEWEPGQSSSHSLTTFRRPNFTSLSL
jgi:hypothetical protein